MTQLETPAKTPKTTKTPKRTGQRAKIEAALKLQREAKTEFKSKEFVSDPESEPEQTIQPQKENTEPEPIEEAGEIDKETAFLETLLVGADDISTLRCNKTGRKWWVDVHDRDRVYTTIRTGLFRETVIPGRMFCMFFSWRLDPEEYRNILSKNSLTEIEFDRKLADLILELFPMPGRVGVMYAKNEKKPYHIQVRMPYYTVRDSETMQSTIDAVRHAFSETFGVDSDIDRDVYKNEVGLTMIGSEDEEGSGVFRELDLESGTFVEIDHDHTWWWIVLFPRMDDTLTIPDAPDMSRTSIPTLEEFLTPYAIDETENITHTSMNGLPSPGKWSIPIEMNGQFLRVLHRHTVTKGQPAYFSECIEAGKAYNFFMDFDFELDALNLAGLLDNGEQQFNNYLHGIITEKVFETDVGRSWCRGLIVSSKPGYPNKIHINGDMVCQDRSLAPSIMTAVGSVFRERFPDVDWKKAFDLGPYTSGLRMLGCRKPGGIPYQVYNLKTGKHEPTNLNIMCRTSLRSNATALGGVHGDGSRSVDPETDCTVRAFVDHLRTTNVFNTPLKVKKVRLSGERFINVALSDPHCPYIGRAHKDGAQRLYIFITKSGAWLKCWDAESCGHGRLRADLTESMRMLMDQFPDETEKIPEITEDVCGGGESDEETVVERPRKRKTSKSKKKRAAPKEDVGDRIESPALDKSVIRALYNDDADRHDQPALTGYLNRFLAYIHQNDTYGFRLRDDQPFDICRKASVTNKMERFEIRDSPFTVWCKNENRREFTDVVFDTSDKKHPTTTLNLFGGYKAKMLDRKVEAEEVEIFLYHLRDVICRGHEENYHYYLCWWAWFFQKGRTGIMVILLSELKGTGKNIIPELLAEHVIGDKYVAVTDKIDTVVQRFNAIMVEKALIVANELKDVSRSAKESSRVEEVLKTMIKDRTTAIEKKGLDTIVVPSTVNFHGTSNNLVPLKVDRDQRRYVFLDVSPHKKGDFAYFETLAEFVKSHANEIFTFLNQIDLTGWGPEKNLVQTEYTKRVQRAFINPIHQFWYDSGYCDVDFEKTPHPKNPIYKQYTTWHQESKGGNAKVCADTWFGRQIVSMGYTIQKSQTFGERERFVTGKMSDEAKTLMIDASTTV